MPLTLEQLTKKMRVMTAKAVIAPEIAAARLAPVMVATAKEIIGTHLLRDLMPSTQAERSRLGYPPNDPLLRTGEFRDTIEGDSLGPVATVGTNDPRGAWFENGTVHMRPFSNFALTLDAVLPEALAIAEEEAAQVI